MATSTEHSHPSLVHRALTLLALALFAAAMWAAWLGWDTEYYELAGVTQGPYREWQVLGCGLSVTAGAVLAQVWHRAAEMVVPLAAAAIVGFSVPWTVRAMQTDDSGLFGVGLIMLLVGGGISLAVVLAITGAALRRLRARHSRQGRTGAPHDASRPSRSADGEPGSAV